MKIRLEDRYTAETGEVQMTGVQALARLPHEHPATDRPAGLETAVVHFWVRGLAARRLRPRAPAQRGLLDECDVVFRPGVNEELAATSVQGTQVAPS